jgi:hypothetical protein
MGNPTLSTNPSSGRKEFKDKEAELDSLSKELAEKELELSTLELKLSWFEDKYARTVGILFAELDEIEKDIAKELLRLNPKEEYRQGFQRAEKKAKVSRDAVDEKIAQGNKKPFEPSDELKNLFRKVAKAIHPDFATNLQERKLRNTLMRRANEAYKKGDAEGLKKILGEWENRDKEIHPEKVESPQLDQFEIKIRQIKLRISEIELKISELKKSELYQLMVKVEQAEKEGRDLLGEMSKQLQAQVIDAKKLLESLQQRE